MPIITVDGNIGAGKTTILNYIHTNYNINIDLEPIEKWKSYLDNIYLNNSNYFNFQIRVWMDRTWIQEKSNNLLLMERSPYFINNTFNTYIYNNNLITENEQNIINELYEKSKIIWNSKYYIYLYSNPKKCYDRIIKRGRINELDISPIYLEKIHLLHEKAYENIKNNIEYKNNVICIDVENKTLDEISIEIINFMNKLE
jgi:deoxyadenosine/deoxycytidine kinase